MNRKKYQNIVKLHQSRAKKLWHQHTMNIKKEGSPGPGQYHHEPNQYFNSFMGEGKSCAFGKEPRLPSQTSHSDRILAIKKQQLRRTSLDPALSTPSSAIKDSSNSNDYSSKFQYIKMKIPFHFLLPHLIKPTLENR